MLDIIESAGYPVRCLYLGTLTDICDRIFCGPFLCTWRGADKKTGLMSLLASVWRQEEDRLGIKRRHNGCIAGKKDANYLSSRFNRVLKEKSWSHKRHVSCV